MNPSESLAKPEVQSAKSELVSVGRFFAEKSWSVATSSNYSTRLGENQIAITRSGIDKYNIVLKDIIEIDQYGNLLANIDHPYRPSAETLIHTTLYSHFPEIHAVLHTHSALSTRLSMKFLKDNCVRFVGYEMQKAISSHLTHEESLIVPILPNSQDMKQFAANLQAQLKLWPKNTYGFLIAGHGLYAWGKDIAEARRHVEAFEFLFQCLHLEISGI